ncbi:MAG TPA: pilus assembly protein [Kribbella sp.]
MKPGSERGDITIEAVVGVVALFLILGLGLVGVRVLIADAAIDEAARSAARAASIAHDGRAAAITADHRARAVLAEQRLACGSLDVSVDASDFAKSLGETGYVTATVTCVVPLADLVPGIGGSKTLRSAFRSPIDRYGARS